MACIKNKTLSEMRLLFIHFRVEYLCLNELDDENMDAFKYKPLCDYCEMKLDWKYSFCQLEWNVVGIDEKFSQLCCFHQMGHFLCQLQVEMLNVVHSIFSLLILQDMHQNHVVYLPHMAKIIAFYDLITYRYYSPVWNRNAEGKLQLPEEEEKEGEEEKDGGDDEGDDDDDDDDNDDDNRKEKKGKDELDTG